MSKKSEKECKTIVICDNQPLFRLGLKNLLERQGNFYVIAEASNSRELSEALARSQPDVVILDIFIAERENFEILRQIISEYPSVKVMLIVPRSIHPIQLTTAIQTGVSSCILRDSPPDLVIKALQSVIVGVRWIQRELMDVIIKMINSAVVTDENLSMLAERLTEKEKQVLILIAKGLTNKEIARQLKISLQTVKTHVSKILQKLKVKTRMEAARYAIAILKSSFDGQRLKVTTKSNDKTLLKS